MKRLGFTPGEKFFHVRGEVLSSSETWAIHLDDYIPVDGPKK